MDYGARLRKMRQAKKFSIYRLHEITGLSQGGTSASWKKAKTSLRLKPCSDFFLQWAFRSLSFSMRTMKSPISMNEKRSLWKHSELCLMSRQSFTSS